MKIRLSIAFVLLSLLAALATGCSSTDKKPTEDYIVASKALELANGLRTAYQEKSFSDMARFCTKDAYRSIADGLKSFDSVEIVFIIRRVELNRDGDTADMLVDWKGKWVSGDKATEKKGTALFMLGGNPMKLQEIKRLSPFSQP